MATDKDDTTTIDDADDESTGTATDGNETSTGDSGSGDGEPTEPDDDEVEAAPPKKVTRQSKKAAKRKRRETLGEDADHRQLVEEASAAAYARATEEAAKKAKRANLEEVDRVKAEKADADQKVTDLEKRLEDEGARREYSDAVSDLDVKFAKGAKKALRALVEVAKKDDSSLTATEAIESVLEDNQYLLEVEKPAAPTPETRSSTGPAPKKKTGTAEPPPREPKSVTDMSQKEFDSAFNAALADVH